MAQDKFRALLLEKHDNTVTPKLTELSLSDLPEGDVLVDVAYSSLNYKDGMAIANAGPIVRSFPFVPGIDCAGTVLQSSSPEFKRGDQVIATGWGIGERHWGGFAQRARFNSDWLIKLPAGLTLRQSMAVGSAGFTSMLCVMALEHLGLQPGGRDVVVTGAAGGVGSVAVAILAKLGYRVVASTGRQEAGDYLRRLGAAEIMDRAALATTSHRPMESERWGGAVDSVGGTTLASLIRQMAYGTAVAACGLAGGTDLNTTVYPFILRGVSLLGIDSVACPQPKRKTAWERLARELPLDLLDEVETVIGLTDLPGYAELILKGGVRGRAVVDVNQ